MLRSIEVEIDSDGNVTLKEPYDQAVPARAMVSPLLDGNMKATVPGGAEACLRGLFVFADSRKPAPFKPLTQDEIYKGEAHGHLHSVP